ncbi:MAG: porin family protein [Gemmatimonadetes bacterium]|uniref:Porin family protein n=1 Tax=Candidatus Kutchimonas denitrificans TaxID=3056748 RepID=A0AAE4ZAW8_9BACT|nr:porin family protein [Gemmatimonadota bacterium]NIR75426.1 porin family protein [Candidatus Kutchimonas denitrificans]NIS01740.1 porin family protein [Gemmatimonadota bacterium]NIT67522.1 porin family protein [Gemmatimonadota bacterium]NIU53385.1 outer membrane beta-barrel protein [Gemmatimonadota bacterium]
MNLSVPQCVTPAITALLVLGVTAPASAQFEEADTLPRFSVGAFGDFGFRNKRGETAAGDEVSFTSSPGGGLRLDYRLTQTLTLAAFGSYTRVQERVEFSDGTVSVFDPHFDLFHFGGELLVRVKPRIPGYFILGGGAQHVAPEGDDPGLQLTSTDSFTETFGIAGAGYEFASTRGRAFRVNFRFFLINPADQERYNPKSIEIDFVLGAAFILRL